MQNSIIGGFQRWLHQTCFLLKPWRLAKHRSVDIHVEGRTRIKMCDCGRAFYIASDVHPAFQPKP